MVVIIKNKSDTKDAMFRKFSRAIMEEDLVNELRKRQFYKKPSLKRKDDEKELLARRARMRRFANKKFFFQKRIK